MKTNVVDKVTHIIRKYSRQRKLKQKECKNLTKVISKINPSLSNALKSALKMQATYAPETLGTREETECGQNTRKSLRSFQTMSPKALLCFTNNMSGMLYM